MKKFEWIEAMRGIAALWVLVSHTALALRDFAHASSPKIIENGFLGVDFFFVLSGFIIAFSSQQLVTDGRGWKDYATARAVRIYVPYLPVGVAMLALYGMLPGVSLSNRAAPGLFTTLTLLPSDLPPALSVAWTLVHEVVFYILFSVFFVSRRALVALLAGWVAAILWTWALAIPLSRTAMYLLHPLNLCFVLGVAVAWATRNGVSSGFSVASAIAGLAIVLSQAGTAEPNRPLVAFGFAALVAASCSPAARQRAPSRILVFLGAASYAIYLVHNTAISVFIRATKEIGNPLVLFVVVSVLALSSGLAYHVLYERRALHWLRSRMRREGTVLSRDVAAVQTPTARN